MKNVFSCFLVFSPKDICSACAQMATMLRLSVVYFTFLVVFASAKPVSSYFAELQLRLLIGKYNYRLRADVNAKRVFYWYFVFSLTSLVFDFVF